MNDQVQQSAPTGKQGYKWNPGNAGRTYNYGAPLGIGGSAAGRKLRGSVLLRIASTLQYLSAGFLALLSVGAFLSGGTITNVMGMKFAEEGGYSSIYILVGMITLLMAAGYFIIGRLAMKWRSDPERASALLIIGSVLLGVTLFFGLGTRNSGAVGFLIFGPGFYFAGGLLNYLQVRNEDPEV
ncbi:MAG: hypothetical protein QM270_06710 [Bacillota bacterium]|nr:hypothetical protein [Bacillota bacterium]